MEEGGGILTALAMLALLPVMIVLWLVKLAAGVMRFRMQRRQLLPANELLLRRASHPVGLVAVALVAAHIFQLHGAQDAAAALAHDPGAYWLPAVLFGAALAYGLASFVTGIRRCSNPRDGTFTRAALKLVIGAAIAAYLWRLHPWGGLLCFRWYCVHVAPWLQSSALAVGVLGAVWLAATSAVRLLVLTIDSGNALRIAGRTTRRRNEPMRPGRF